MNITENLERADLLISSKKRVLKQLEIVDEFAICFADYCLSIFGRLRDNEITIEEALEIYKKTTK